MKLAEESRGKLEEFFREFLADDDFRLPAIYFHAGRLSELLTRSLKIHGITIGKNIFVTPEFIFAANDQSRKKKIHVELAAHEIAHVLQYEREGFARFFYKYFKSYFDNLRGQKNWNGEARRRAYLNIPFEIEARETAAKFVVWNKNRRREK